MRDDFLNMVRDAFYNESELDAKHLTSWRDWFGLYVSRLEKETATNGERKALMDSANPKYVLRNYMAQMAIDKADNGDNTLIDELHRSVNLSQRQRIKSL